MDTPIKTYSEIPRRSLEKENDANSAKPSLSNGSEPNRTTKKCKVLYLIVCSFHHTLGNSAEFIFPPLPKSFRNDIETARKTFSDPTAAGESTSNQIKQMISHSVILPNQWKLLPFYALPDGAHNVDSDTSYFTLPSLEENGGLVYAISCYRQVSTHTVKEDRRGNDVHRSKMQKAVVAICSHEMFGAIEAKLKAVTYAYFEAQDFHNHKCLVDAYQILRKGIEISPSLAVVDIPIGGVVKSLGYKTLGILKLIMLQKKVAIFGLPCSKVCKTIITLLSLIPTELSPNDLIGLNENQSNHGFKLDLFDQEHTMYQPYLPLQEIETLKTKQSFLVGVCNMLFTRMHSPEMDVLIDITEGKNIDLKNNDYLKHCFALTPADRRFMDEILNCSRLKSSSDGRESLRSSLDQESSGRNDYSDNTVIEDDYDTQWEGSDSWIRMKFHGYFNSFFNCLSTVPHIFDASYKETFNLDCVEDFNWEWVNLFMNAPIFEKWSSDPKVTPPGGQTARHPNARDVKNPLYNFAGKLGGLFGSALESPRKLQSWLLQDEEVESDSTNALSLNPTDSPFTPPTDSPSTPPTDSPSTPPTDSSSTPPS